MPTVNWWLPASAAGDGRTVERCRRGLHGRPDADAADGFGVKKEGVPLYKLARKGVEVPREPRLIHIYKFEFSAYQEPLGHFQIACTKGTYVRSLAHELGQKLGCGAHLATLRRAVSGKFDVKDAIPLEDALRLTLDELEKRVIPFLKLAAAG